MLQSLAAKLESHRLDTGAWPRRLAALLDPVDGLGAYARAAELTDPWGRRWYYRVAGDGSGYALFTLGSDGRLGGQGDAADRQAVPVRADSTR